MYVYFYPLFCGKDLCAKISEELENYIDNSYCIEIIVYRQTTKSNTSNNKTRTANCFNGYIIDQSMHMKTVLSTHFCRDTNLLFLKTLLK